VRHVVMAAALLLTATACQTTTADPAAERLREALEHGIDLASFKPDDALRARYLPPVGSGKPKDEFVVGMPLEVATFALAPGDQDAGGTPPGPVLRTAGGGATDDADTYTRQRPALDPNV